MMRSARDDRYLYIRNFQPELPYVGFIPYRNESPIMQELVRRQAEGTQPPAAARWMRTSRLTIRAKAIRYGYKPSAETRTAFVASSTSR
jgi:hypothetical protein